MIKSNLAIGLAAIITMGVSVSPIVVGQDTLKAQDSKQKKKLPPPPAPPSRGVPGNRTVSASMSDNNCELNLVALAPEFKQYIDGQVSENSVWGQTVAAYPTFWFFVPTTTSSTKLEFSIQDGEEDIYRTNIPTPQQSGILGVKIPPSQQPLQLNRNYHWTLKAKVCDRTSTINRVHIDGWVTRIKLPGKIVGQDNWEMYSAHGIWYDAVTSLAQQRLQKPQDVWLEKDWNDLLNSANLSKIAKQPLVSK
jgi:Domain of Unknown Function (DUF928)